MPVSAVSAHSTGHVADLAARAAVTSGAAHDARAHDCDSQHGKSPGIRTGSCAARAIHAPRNLIRALTRRLHLSDATLRCHLALNLSTHTTVLPPRLPVECQTYGPAQTAGMSTARRKVRGHIRAPRLVITSTRTAPRLHYRRRAGRELTAPRATRCLTSEHRATARVLSSRHRLLLSLSPAYSASQLRSCRQLPGPVRP